MRNRRTICNKLYSSKNKKIQPIGIRKAGRREEYNGVRLIVFWNLSDDTSKYSMFPYNIYENVKKKKETDHRFQSLLLSTHLSKLSRGIFNSKHVQPNTLRIGRYVFP